MVKEKEAKTNIYKGKKEDRQIDRQTPGSAEKQRSVRARVREKVRIKDKIANITQKDDDGNCRRKTQKSIEILKSQNMDNRRCAKGSDQGSVPDEQCSVGDEEIVGRWRREC